jgi:aldehyde dehydrogenase (NAD+)
MSVVEGENASRASHNSVNQTWDASMVIDGRSVESAGGSTFANIDPYTERQLGVAQDGTVADVDAAVAAAQRAFTETSWARDHAFRARCLAQMRRAFLAHQEELREVLVAEVGCPIKMTKTIQLEESIDAISIAVELARTYPFERYMSADRTTTPQSERLVIHEPFGVCALITPYNYPVHMFTNKVGSALAGGNTVVVKPSPLTPLTTYLLGKIANEETELPPGVLNVVTSASVEVAEHLVEHPLVQMIHFTGSTPVGKKIMTSAAKGVKKVGLELGGKSANIVLEDADIEAVTRFNVTRMSRFSGQGCSNLTRLLLPRSHYEEALEIAADQAQKIPWGDPRDPATHMGPQINRAGQERCLQYVETAVQEGGRIVAGGGVPASATSGFFVEATVIADVDRKARLAQEEIFGPLLAVIPYATEQEAIDIANDSDFGLAGAVYSASTERAVGVARQVRAGMMEVNGASRNAPDTPFGGMKQSGLGRERGQAGMEDYLDVRVIAHHPMGT